MPSYLLKMCRQHEKKMISYVLVKGLYILPHWYPILTCVKCLVECFGYEKNRKKRVHALKEWGFK